ncbi:LysM peptidoglycan-binding domain-containing protein [Paraburkholderia caballeronis]|uniref:LysM peptidoglycan-binding domain-containing protein n=1 Tax=Paraburkholderia caballeronis TaxID=416943 RepID=UPI0010D1E279|nr:LysM peptidoglycan-binding domain-containing protein [Paraburkholderia caballeronis]TDV05551.1 LysM domain-containing protein [Paraburkholderia caballeronis]TDV09178.1 LysM domain-containing protein [Paraburkholderia caballeronis]TDV20298.1 LysM domain-containing protein [Paraburkholderia caballeronis]
MEYDIYVVARGDTLSRIAQAHGTDADQLASLNGIREPNFIYPGQKLKIPKSTSHQTDGDDFYSELWVRFVDAVGKPIVALVTRVVTASGEYHFTTDDMGFIPPVQTQEKGDNPHIFVSKMGGGEKKVATLKSHPGVHQHTLRSPKVKIRVPLRKHDGLPDHDPGKPIKLEPGEVQHNRNLDGHPVINVGVECPNKENLRLGQNAKYRDYIIAAGKKSGFEPQAIASVVNIEAEKKRVTITKTKTINGKTKKATKTVSTGEWDSDSSNPRSTARGMTQFLAGTWLGEATRPGTFLNQKSAENCWLKKDKAGRYTILPEHKNDILDLRTNAEAAIMAAVDYGMYNFRSLESNGYQFGKLNDGERAKILYLTHHLGSGDANRYLAGTIVEEDTYSEAKPHHPSRLISRGAKTLLIAQIGTGAAAKRAKENGDNYVKAHRFWLSNLIDSGINFKNFACDPTKLDDVRPLLEIVTVAGGKNPTF